MTVVSQIGARVSFARALAFAVIVAVAGHGVARAECETRVSKVAMPAAAPSAARLNMMLVKSRALVGEAPAAKPGKVAAHRAKARKAKGASGHAAGKARRRHLAAASRPRRQRQPRAVRPVAAPMAAPVAIAAAPAFADIRTEVCSNGPEPILAMLARLTAPPEPQQSKVGAAAAPLDGPVEPGDLADLGSDGVAPGVIGKPPTATPGTTFLPPTTVDPADPTTPTEPDGPVTPPFVTPTDTGVDPATGRPVSPLDGGGQPTTTTLLPPTVGPPGPQTTGPQTTGPTGPRTDPPGPQTPTSPTPEPATWALLIAGFGVVGARLRAASARRSLGASFHICSLQPRLSAAKLPVAGER
ncbi:MAG: hypothetical protein DI570_23280 [Phenylobacterium zucineum]|nr:MAG: hypothetical protein DI570_23280 [Phenylobacterium zucineum]